MAKKEVKEVYDDKKDREAIVRMVSRSAGKILDVGTGDCCCMAQLLAKKGFMVVAVGKSRRNLKKAKKEGIIQLHAAESERLLKIIVNIQ